ncbi:MAG: peroxidase-related enzyme [Acidimicrobiales bacterium]
MVWVRIIEMDEATGSLREAYDWQAQRLGEPTDFTKLGSLYPDIVWERLRLYKAVEGCPSGLSQIERQLAAFVVSRLNATTHCGSGLEIKLTELGADRSLIDLVIADPGDVRSGDERIDAICAYAAKLTSAPATMTEADVERLREVGLDDLDLLDLNNMVAYYNYLNRVSNGLGLFDAIPAEHALRAMPH